MIMTTFTENHDFTGKTVRPFVTYAVSGLGSTERDYTASCPGARSPRAWRSGRRRPSTAPTSRTGCATPDYAPPERPATSPGTATNPRHEAQRHHEPPPLPGHDERKRWTSGNSAP